VHIFDVCGTLFHDDTTAGLLIWHFSRARRSWRRLVALSLFRRSSPVHLAVTVLEYLSGRHLAKAVGLALLCGEVPEALRSSAVSYVDHLIGRRQVAEVFARFEAASATGGAVLASASLDPVIEELARRYRVRYVSSRLMVRDGRFTGSLALDLTGRKTEVLEQCFGDIFTGESHCYTDNFSDLGLLQRCSMRHVVLRKPSHRERWSLEDAEYIEAFR